jgi:hypothetical protein
MVTIMQGDEEFSLPLWELEEVWPGEEGYNTPAPLPEDDFFAPDEDEKGDISK